MSSTVTWDLVEKEYAPLGPTVAATLRLRQATHRTIKKVLPDIELIPDTTAVAPLREFINILGQVRVAGDVDPSAWEEARDTLLRLLSPTSPGFMEMLWHQLGKPDSIYAQPHLVYDEGLAQEENPAAKPTS
jgi:leucyl-tRNA synthetase